MVLEIAHITIDPLKAAEFEEAVGTVALPVFRSAEGCHGMRLERVVEDPAQYRLVVKWISVEAHVDTFRSSEGFRHWRAIAGPFFVEPPRVEHWSMCPSYF